MPLTDIELCSMALVKLGASPIASFDENSAEADIAYKLYDATLKGLIVSHPWGFSLAQVTLVQDTDPPECGFAFAFSLPDDVLRTISAGSGGRGRGLIYRIVGNRLLADSGAVDLTYQRLVDPSLFPPHFVQAFVSRFAAELCNPITESTSRTQSLFSLAAAELKHAKLIDSQQTSPSAVEDFTLVSVRG